MSAIEWKALNAETSYCQYREYLLKKRRLKGYFVYTVWWNDVLMHTCYNDFQFTELANKILNNDLIS